MNEQELIQRCRQGNRGAQRELYAQNADRVYRLLLRMTANRDDAFELAQDVFVRVFNNMDRFDARSSLRTWIYQIALNEGRQFLRRRKRRQIRPAEIEPSHGENWTSDTDNRLDLAAALDRLPEEERTLLVLRYFEQLSYDEIAEVIGKPSGTVGSGLNRARKLLRAALSNEKLSEP